MVNDMTNYLVQIPLHVVRLTLALGFAYVAYQSGLKFWAELEYFMTYVRPNGSFEWHIIRPVLELLAFHTICTIAAGFLVQVPIVGAAFILISAICVQGVIIALAAFFSLGVIGIVIILGSPLMLVLMLAVMANASLLWLACQLRFLLSEIE